MSPSETLPKTMTVIEISEPGGPEVLIPAQRPTAVRPCIPITAGGLFHMSAKEIKFNVLYPPF